MGGRLRPMENFLKPIHVSFLSGGDRTSAVDSAPVIINRKGVGANAWVFF